MNGGGKDVPVTARSVRYTPEATELLRCYGLHEAPVEEQLSGALSKLQRARDELGQARQRHDDWDRALQRVRAERDVARAERETTAAELRRAVEELGEVRWRAEVATATAEHAARATATAPPAAGAAGPARAVEVAPDGAVGRLEAARRLTEHADAKAVGLLTAAGVLAAAGAVAADGLPPVAVLGAGAALVVALVALLGVLVPRGGRPTAWLPACDPAVELGRVAGVAAVKHRLLRLAVAALVVAVTVGAAGAALALTVGGAS